MFDYTNIYKETRRLDDEFAEKYNHDEEIRRKNRLELLVELGELANETKCFKYWSKKTGDKEKILEEYIDCVFMSLYFCHMADVSLEEEFPESLNADIIDTFVTLFKYASNNTYISVYMPSAEAIIIIDGIA